MDHKRAESKRRLLLILLVSLLTVSQYLLCENSRLGFADDSRGNIALNTTANRNSSINITSKIFPPALDMMKRGIPLENTYTCFDEDTSFSLAEAKKRRDPPIAGLEHVNIEEETKWFSQNTKTCSCDAPASTPESRSPLCCHRCVFSGHKMGTFLQMSLEGELQKHGIRKADFADFTNGRDIPYTKDHLLRPHIDFRDVMILRNIYDSLISGYLYHKEGKECWLDWMGREAWDPNLFPSFWMKRWMRYIDLSSQKSKVYSTLCHCLANETEANGMKIYIDFSFHAFYWETFQFWALASGLGCKSIQKRVRTFCFEDLASKSTSSASVMSLIGFLTDNSTQSNAASLDDKSEEDSGQAYDGGHSTSHDPTLRQRLLGIIKQIDSEYYNNDIAWLQSVIPCR